MSTRTREVSEEMTISPAKALDLSAQGLVERCSILEQRELDRRRVGVEGEDMPCHSAASVSRQIVPLVAHDRDATLKRSRHPNAAVGRANDRKIAAALGRAHVARVEYPGAAAQDAEAAGAGDPGRTI